MYPDQKVTSKLPTRVYKYLTPDRVDVLEKCLIRFTQFGAFNDPLEGRPDFTSITSDVQALQHLRDILPGEIRSSYDSLSIEIKSRISFEKYSALANLRAKAVAPHFPAIVNSLTGSVRDLIARKLDQAIGVLSLSDIPDNMLMWSHYAASHHGFALGFDPSHRWFNDKKSEDDELRHLRKVVYTKSRPQAQLIDFDGTRLFLLKKMDWEYEREWRILRPLVDADVVLEAPDYNIHLFRFPPEAVAEVVIGTRATAELKDVLTGIVRTDQELSHVRIRRARLDTLTLEISVEDFCVA